MLAYLNTPTKFDDPKGPRYTSLFFSFPHNTSFQHLRAFSRVRMSSSKKSHLMKHWNKEVEHEEHWRSCGILLFTMNYKLWSKQLSWQGTSTTISDLRVTLVIPSFVAWKVISSFILSIQIWVKDNSYDFIFKVNVMNILFLFIWSCQ